MVQLNAQTIGFKEWSMVCDALLQGVTSVIIRKGGISEGRGGFRWQVNDFLLFPTHYHEQETQIHYTPTEEVRGDMQQTDKIFIRAKASIVASATIKDWDVAAKLAPFHVWNESVIKDRFGWGREEAISLAVVKIWRLNQPFILSPDPAFGGCKSWIELPDLADLAGTLVRSEAEVAHLVEQLTALGVSFD